METELLRQKKDTDFNQSTSQFVIKRKKQNLKQKAVVFDSGTLINLSMNGLLYILEELKQLNSIKFFITHYVKNETVNRPIGIPRFELGALRIQNLIENKTIEMPESINIPNSQIESITQDLLDKANHTVQSNGKWINIVSNAEMSCLALSMILTRNNVENFIAIDERTTRILSEKPQNLKEIMEKKLHQEIKIDEKNFSDFKDFKFIRSTELVYVAHKKGILDVAGAKALEAALYATKFHGSSVSFEEINVLKRL